MLTKHRSAQSARRSASHGPRVLRHLSAPVPGPLRPLPRMPAWLPGMDAEVTHASVPACLGGPGPTPASGSWRTNIWSPHPLVGRLHCLLEDPSGAGPPSAPGPSCSPVLPSITSQGDHLRSVPCLSSAGEAQPKTLHLSFPFSFLFTITPLPPPRSPWQPPSCFVSLRI